MPLCRPWGSAHARTTGGPRGSTRRRRCRCCRASRRNSARRSSTSSSVISRRSTGGMDAMARVMRILAAIGGAGLALYAGIRFLAPTVPSGPVPIVWDKEPCAHCRMHIGDPRFAAQLQAADGRVASFDDPGCLFAYVEAEAPEVTHLYFH